MRRDGSPGVGPCARGLVRRLACFAALQAASFYHQRSRSIFLMEFEGDEEQTRARGTRGALKARPS